MTDPTPPHRRSPLEHDRDNDLAVAWLAGAEDMRERMQGRIDALEPERDRLQQVVRQGRDLVSGDAVGREWKRGCNAFLQAARAVLKDTTNE